MAETSRNVRAMGNVEKNVALDYRYIADFCERNRIRSLTFFGSVLREDFTDKSDLDILVTFEDASRRTLITRIGMALELEEHFGRRVDFRYPSELSPYIRDRVLAEAVEFYAR